MEPICKSIPKSMLWEEWNSCVKINLRELEFRTTKTVGAHGKIFLIGVHDRSQPWELGEDEATVKFKILKKIKK
jgi:hypothetical protein